MRGAGFGCIIYSVMQADFLTTFISVAIMVVMVVPGFILRKLKLLPEKAVGALVAVLIYVSQPFLTVSSFLEKDYMPELLTGMLAVAVLSMLLMLLAFGAARLVFRLVYMKKGKEFAAKESVCAMCSSFGNVGFMGIPVMKMLFPNNPETLIYTAVFMVGFNIVAFTLGVYVITGDAKYISLRRAFLNAPTAAIVVALPLFFLKRYIPESVLTPASTAISYLADMTLPLSMIILGVRLAEVKPRALLSDPAAYLVCFMKLVITPLLTLGVLVAVRAIFHGLDVAAAMTCYVVATMPTASSTLSLSELYGGDSAVAVRSMILSTLLSVLTVPLVMLLGTFI